MAEHIAKRNVDRCPTHPGEVLRDDVLPSLSMSVSDAAKALGVTRQTLHRILAGTTAVTPEMALRLGKFCGNGPDLWIRMQEAHDLWRAARRIADQLASIKTAKVA
jgi:addiction module HigA family antidote